MFVHLTKIGLEKCKEKIVEIVKGTPEKLLPTCWQIAPAPAEL
jgi:hypothetical protein